MEKKYKVIWTSEVTDSSKEEKFVEWSDVMTYVKSIVMISTKVLVYQKEKGRYRIIREIVTTKFSI